MFSSYKSQIVLQSLVPFAIAYGFLCLILVGNMPSEVFSNWEKLAALGFLSVGIALLQDLIPKPFKETLVFWRLRERLPGHRAFVQDRSFSDVLSRDEVVDIDLREGLTPKYQNRLFYQVYDKFRDNGNVTHYSYRYLQWRELATIYFVSTVIGYILVGYGTDWVSWNAILVCAVGICFFISSIFAARSSANLLIDYVLLSERLKVSDVS